MNTHEPDRARQHHKPDPAQQQTALLKVISHQSNGTLRIAQDTAAVGVLESADGRIAFLTDPKTNTCVVVLAKIEVPDALRVAKLVGELFNEPFSGTDPSASLPDDVR